MVEPAGRKKDGGDSSVNGGYDDDEGAIFEDPNE
jgi:hypothetical protein